MHSNGISAQSFKGAYFVKGSGKEVKDFEDAAKSKTYDKPDSLCTKVVGDGYTSCDMPACLLVVTGDNDIKAYKKFLKNEDKFCRSIPKNELKRIKADNCDDWASRIRETIINHMNSYMEIVKENCKFKNTPDTLDAADALRALDADKFDWRNGKIKDNKSDYNNSSMRK